MVCCVFISTISSHVTMEQSTLCLFLCSVATFISMTMGCNDFNLIFPICVKLL